MKKILYILPMLALLVLASCSEKDEVGEYENWQARNLHYVDSIANLANNGTNGWSKMIAYNLVSTTENPDLDNTHYIYIQKLEDGTGTRMPEYNDSIRVHYLGRLIPSTSYSQGYVFGKSYSTYTFNEATDVPAIMGVSGNATGFTTAVMNMVEGDRWRVVVPYYLGFGTEDYLTASIPAYSTLIFEMKLARIYKYKIDTDTTWH